MRRALLVSLAILALPIAYLLAHWALIEVGREVIVLRTEEADGSWHETRLWIVDEGGFPWLHGGNSRWMHNLRARAAVEIERDGDTSRYRAHPVSGPHPRIDELLREKYGLADRWVRFVGADTESTTVVRMEPLEGP